MKEVSTALDARSAYDYRTLNYLLCWACLLRMFFAQATTSAQTVNVPGTANIFGAGHSTPPSPSGGGGGTLPVQINIPPGIGSLIFTNVSGGVDWGNLAHQLSPPDGLGITTTRIASYGGIAGISAGKIVFLTGLFLDDGEPADPAPPGLNFSNLGFTSIAPSLRQPFFIGDGLTGTGSGATQVFYVPTNATRLFLGIADAQTFNGNYPPGYYGDNSGSYTSTVVFSNSATVTMTISAGIGGSASASPVAAQPGLPTTLAATPSAGYYFASWTVNSSGGGSISSTTANPATFTFGAGNAKVTPNFLAVPKKTGGILKLPDLNLNPTGQATGLVLVIHGWTPPWAPSPYSQDAAMLSLANTVAARIVRDHKESAWDVRLFDWSNLSVINSQSTPQNAVRNGVLLGSLLAPQVINAGYKSVHLVSHSAGTWMANSLGAKLCANDIRVNATFLDAFVPSKVASAFKSQYETDNIYTQDQLGVQIPLAEQYFTTFPLGTIPIYFPGLGNVLPNCANYNIAALKFADYGAAIDGHGWPVRWYMQTVIDSNYTFGFGVGFQDAFDIHNAKGSHTILPFGTIEAPPPTTQNQILSSEHAFTSLPLLVQGGNGLSSSTANGLKLATTNLIWQAFGINLTNGCNFGSLIYELSNECNSVVGLWIDDKPIAFIQSSQQSELRSMETFPLPTAITSGPHTLNVSFESLDGNAVEAHFIGAGFYFALTPPPIKAIMHSSTNIELSWEGNAGIRYQMQCSTGLNPNDWIPLGGIISTTTNAPLSFSEDLSLKTARFYRIAVLP